jgi:peptide deformylase
MLQRTISNYGIFYIRTLGDPVLYQGVKEVTEIDGRVKGIVDSMYKFLHPGAIGLAANQVGVQKDIFVWSIDKPPQVIINPSVEDWSNKSFESVEGCLSIPGAQFKIMRHKSVTISGLDIDGNEVVHETKTELEAALFQHEIDHLSGILAINNRNLIDWGRVR